MSRPTDSKSVLAVDIGGTKTAVGIVRGERLLGSTRFPTASHPDPDDLVAAIKQAGDDLAGRYGVTVDAGAAGLAGIDRISGIIRSAANLPFRDFPFAAELSRKLGGLPVLVEEDANCGVLAEATCGAARGSSDAVFLTVSTGVGMGVIAAGRLVRGVNGAAGEAGHIQVVADGERCGCGALGCLEAYASGPAIARLGQRLVASGADTRLAAMRADPGSVTASDVTSAAEAGDPACHDLVRCAADRLAFALHLLQRLVDPELVLLGGGVMRSAWVRDLLVTTYRSAFPTELGRQIRFTTPALGDDAVLLGAAQLWTAADDPASCAAGLT